MPCLCGFAIILKGLFNPKKMAYRFTNTEKWADSWFSGLTQLQMLLFIYLCDNCDIAGFIELNYKRWANDLNSSTDTIEGACKGLARGLIYSNTGDCIYIRNFLKHQKNYPLNPGNKAHQGILKRFAIYAHKFDIQDINLFIEGASKGLPSPTGNGNGIGNGIGNGKKEAKVENEKIPAEVEFMEFATASCPNVDKELVRLKYLAWVNNNWRDGNNKKIANWKTKLLNTITYLKPNNYGNNQKRAIASGKKSYEWTGFMPGNNG